MATCVLNRFLRASFVDVEPDPDATEEDQSGGDLWQHIVVDSSMEAITLAGTIIAANEDVDTV